MYELKTKPTNISPLDVIAIIPNEKKRQDAKLLIEIFEEASGKKAVVWGSKQIGFGQYTYKYPTGTKGTIYCTGFSIGTSKISLYLDLDEKDLENQLAKLGKTTFGKSCVYINKLADINTDVLKEMITKTVENATSYSV